jgi:hypothetical protein
VLLLAVVLVLILTACSSGGGENESAPLPTRTPEPPTPTALPEGDRLRIPQAGIDAPLVVSIVANGVMADPPTPDVVALYDFSAYPGLGGMPGRPGNAVISGHRDSDKPCNEGRVPPPCEGIFWHLPVVEVGAELTLFFGRQAYSYRVRLRCVADLGPFEAIVRSTPGETVTMITSTGPFVQGRGYTQRLLVIGERGAGTLSSCPDGTQPAAAATPVVRAPVQATSRPRPSA